jgi:hypothetical protein
VCKKRNVVILTGPLRLQKVETVYVEEEPVTAVFCVVETDRRAFGGYHAVNSVRGDGSGGGGILAGGGRERTAWERDPRYGIVGAIPWSSFGTVLVCQSSCCEIIPCMTLSAAALPKLPRRVSGLGQGCVGPGASLPTAGALGRGSETRPCSGWLNTRRDVGIVVAQEVTFHVGRALAPVQRTVG